MSNFSRPRTILDTYYSYLLTSLFPPKNVSHETLRYVQTVSIRKISTPVRRHVLTQSKFSGCRSATILHHRTFFIISMVMVMVHNIDGFRISSRDIVVVVSLALYHYTSRGP